MKELISKNFDLHASVIPGQTDGMKVFYRPGLTYVDSGLSCDTFNIIHITDARQLTERELVDALDHFRSRNSDYCIWIDEENLTDEVKSFFSNAGVSQQNMEPGMVLDLSSYSLVESPHHQQIGLVRTPQALREYAFTIAANWTPQDQNIIRYFDLVSHHILDERNNILLAALYEDNRPVSVLEMFPTDHETIGIYGLATLAEFRGKGIGSSLLTYALNKAKDFGYRWVILQASEDGIGIYQRLGFRVITRFYEFH